MQNNTYIFDSESIHKFKYCPFCGSETVEVGNYEFMGQVSCSNCSECNEEMEFSVLEEMIGRFPKWWKAKAKLNSNQYK